MDWHWLGKVEALQGIHVVRAQVFNLFGGFYPFSHQFQFQALCQRNNGIGDRGVNGIGTDGGGCCASRKMKKRVI